jgi:hypothetical protein
MIVKMTLYLILTIHTLVVKELYKKKLLREHLKKYHGDGDISLSGRIDNNVRLNKIWFITIVRRSNDGYSRIRSWG